jgi:hypothetical protein
VSPWLQSDKVYYTPMEAMADLPAVARTFRMLEFLNTLEYPIYPLVWDESKLE